MTEKQDRTSFSKFLDFCLLQTASRFSASHTVRDKDRGSRPQGRWGRQGKAGTLHDGTSKSQRLSHHCKESLSSSIQEATWKDYRIVNGIVQLWFQCPIFSILLSNDYYL